MRWPRLGRRRSLANELAFLFFAVTAASLSVLFFLVVPQLQSNLKRQELRSLERVTATSAGILEQAGRDQVPSGRLDRIVRSVAEATNADVTVLGVQQSPSEPRGTPPRFYVVSDSSVEPQVTPDRRQADRAAQSGSARVFSGLGRGRDVEAAQAARQLYYFGRPNWVALYTRDLDDVARTVNLVQQRILAASILALAVALLGSWIVARTITRRVRRLEQAARRLAAGEAIEPIPEASDDELGRLTRAFNDMQQQLARVERSRRDFIANASHELRTPIFSLGGFVELLQDEDLEPEVRENFLATMAEQVERLQKLAVDLLDLSRLDAGSLDLRLESVSLTRVAREVVREFDPALSRRRIEVDVRLAERGVNAVCDRGRVAQIVRILVDNVLRHTPEATRLTLTASCDATTCALTVADDGPGIAAGETAERLFQRFHTGGAGSGSGLGLAIARELAEHMGGGLDVAASVGRTAFTLVLPVAARRSSSVGEEAVSPVAVAARAEAATGEPVRATAGTRAGDDG